MSEYYTARQVQLKKKGGASFAPPVVLAAMTRITVLGMVDAKRDGFNQNAAQWYSVLVESGVHAGMEGYLHTDDFDTPIRLAKVIHCCWEGSETVYGLTKVVHVGPTGQAVATRPWDARCTACNAFSVEHAMFSTEDTLQASKILLEAIDKQIRAKPSKSGSYLYSDKAVMIGVLKVRGNNTTYASHSSQKVDEAFKEVCKDLGYVYAPPVTLGAIKNRHGNLAPLGIQQFDYQCAAPRLIQAALAVGHHPEAMTEIYAAGAAKGKVQPSCGRCEQTVPLMLCP